MVLLQKLTTMTKKLLSSFYLKHFSVWALVCMLFIYFGKQAKAQTVLAQGDIAFTGVSALGVRGFAFVTWVRLDADTEIIISENGYNASGTLRWRKPWGKWKNTSGGFIEAGTVIALSSTFTNRASVGTYTGYAASGATSSSFSLASSTGGHVFAYQGGTPPSTGSDDVAFNGTTPLCALSYIANWLTTGAATTNQSNLPAAFATNAIYLPSSNSAGEYRVRTEKKLSEYKAELRDASKWYQGEANLASFTLTSFPTQAPIASSVTNGGNLAIGQTLTGNYTYTDVESSAETGSTFKWYRSDNAAGLNKAVIASATTKTYVLVAADLNKYISFEVTPRDATEVIGTAVQSPLRGPVTGTLPVNLVSFVSSLEVNSVKLTWRTEAEHNNKGFVIYRSGNDGLFVKIGEVDKNGKEPNTLNLIPYTFIDKQPLNGNNYYKLVQLDNDGTATELGIKQVAFHLQSSTFNFYPNPTKDKVSIQFEAGKYTQLSLNGTNGKILKSITLKAQQSDLQLDLSAYPAGVYLIKFTGAEESLTKKVIKQ